jgi:hypothetical protein
MSVFEEVALERRHRGRWKVPLSGAVTTSTGASSNNESSMIDS